jgi:hypothetical protein
MEEERSELRGGIRFALLGENSWHRDITQLAGTY